MSYRLVVLVGTLLLQTLQLYGFNVKRNRKLSLLHKIIEILPVTPSQLLKIIQKSPEPAVQVVRGTLTAGEPVTAILNESKPIIFSQLYGSRFLSGPSPRRRLLRVKQPSFLKIKDDKIAMSIYEFHRSNIVPTSQITLISQSIFERIKQKFKGMIRRQKSSELPGFNYTIFGNENLQEVFIPDPSQCAVLGVFKQEAGEICCYYPKIIAPSKERMIALIQQDLAGDQIRRVVLVLLLCLTTGYLLKELWALWQKYKTGQGNLIESLKKIFIKSRICCVCKQNLSNMLSKNCLHMSTCQQCWQQQKGVCGECHRRVKQALEIYVC